MVQVITVKQKSKNRSSKEYCLRILIWNVAFPKVLASVHCFTSFTQQSFLKSLNTILLMHIAMLTTHSYNLYLSFRPADGLSSQIDVIQAMKRCS